MTATAGEVRGNPWLRRGGFMSTTRAAQLLGYSAERIRQMCVAGEIDGARQIRVGGKWQVPIEWVNARRAKAPVRRVRDEGE